MNPPNFQDIVKRQHQYYLGQYPETTDCVVLDKQIAEFQADLDGLYKRMLQPASFQERMSQVIARPIMQEFLRAKKEKFATMDCRNKIETLRQNESAAAFSNTSSTAETRIIGKSSTKQYLMLAAGSAMLLASLYLIIKSRS